MTEYNYSYFSHFNKRNLIETILNLLDYIKTGNLPDNTPDLDCIMHCKHNTFETEIEKLYDERNTALSEAKKWENKCNKLVNVMQDNLRVLKGYINK